MYAEGLMPDTALLHERLKSENLIDRAGGIGTIMDLSQRTPSALHFPAWITILENNLTLRRMARTANQALESIWTDHEKTAIDKLNDFEVAVMQIRQDHGNGVQDMKSLVQEAIAKLEKEFELHGQWDGLSTGYASLDNYLCGLRPADMVVIGSRPGTGKTSLSANIAVNIALTGIPVCIFSLEMTSLQLTLRMQCSLARVNRVTIARGQASSIDLARLTEASARLAKAPIIIDETTALTVPDLAGRARRYVQQNGIKLFVVDYAQRMRSTMRNEATGAQQGKELSSGLKDLSKQLKVPFIVNSQLNREVEKTQRSPMMSDLKESGGWEEDADVVLLLDKKGDPTEGCQPTDIIIAKNRNGPTGRVEMIFYKRITRYDEPPKITTADIPPMPATV